MVTEARGFDVALSMSNKSPIYTTVVAAGETENVRLDHSTRLVRADVAVGGTLNITMFTPFPHEVYFDLGSAVSIGKVTLNGITISGGSRLLGYTVNFSNIVEIVRSDGRYLNEMYIQFNRPSVMPANIVLDGPATVAIFGGLENVFQSGDVINVTVSNSLSMIGKRLTILNLDGWGNLTVNVNVYLVGTSGVASYPLTYAETSMILLPLGFDSVTGVNKMLYERIPNYKEFVTLKQRVTALES